MVVRTCSHHGICCQFSFCRILESGNVFPVIEISALGAVTPFADFTFSALLVSGAASPGIPMFIVGRLADPSLFGGRRLAFGYGAPILFAIDICYRHDRICIGIPIDFIVKSSGRFLPGNLDGLYITVGLRFFRHFVFLRVLDLFPGDMDGAGSRAGRLDDRFLQRIDSGRRLGGF